MDSFMVGFFVMVGISVGSGLVILADWLTGGRVPALAYAVLWFILFLVCLGLLALSLAYGG